MTEFRIVIFTHVRENYGAHDWDGKGECPQYWKNKFGDEYSVFVGDTNKVVELGRKGLLKMAQELAEKHGRNSDYYQEYMVDWCVMSCDEETQQEKWDREDKERWAQRKTVAA